MPKNPFHLAFPVTDLAAAREFYGELLGCREGRSSAAWVDFDFFGHQITAHLVGSDSQLGQHNPVDGDAVPVRHFGVILNWDDWHMLSNTLRDSGVSFVIEPRIRFEGQVGEQATLFIRDKSGNALEFKAFKDPSRIFSR